MRSRDTDENSASVRAVNGTSRAGKMRCCPACGSLLLIVTGTPSQTELSGAIDKQRRLDRVATIVSRGKAPGFSPSRDSRFP